MNAPTTTAQDGERERLTCERCGGYLAGDSLDVCELCACKIELDTQSAELAALRAQVEGLSKYVDHDDGCMAIGRDDSRCTCGLTAALAPPQPVAKEK